MFPKYMQKREAVYRLIAGKKQGFVEYVTGVSVLCLIAITSIILVIVFDKSKDFLTATIILLVITVCFSIIDIGLLILLKKYFDFLENRKTKNIIKTDSDVLTNNLISALKKSYSLMVVYEEDEQFLLEFIPINWRRETIFLLLEKKDLELSDNRHVILQMIERVKKQSSNLLKAKNLYLLEQVMYLDGRTNTL